MTMKLWGLNSFHRDTKRKKQEVTCKMAYLKVQNECKCVLRMEYRMYRKRTEAWVFLGVQFVGHSSHLWWDGVCDICKFQPAWTGIKGVISALLWLLHFLLHSRTEWTSVLTHQVREKERDGTGSKQLKGFRPSHITTHTHKG